LLLKFVLGGLLLETEEALLKHVLHLFLVEFTIVWRQANDVQRIADQHCFYLFVERARRAQTRRDVDLQQMRFQMLVEQNIEAVYFEAHISVLVAPLIAAGDLRLVRYACFDDDIFDSVHDFGEVDSIPLEPFLELEQVPLGRILFVLVAVARSATLHVIVGTLVHGVVCQMDEALFEVLWIIRIFLSCKTNKALLEKEYLQRVEACHQDINA
jgi:hypothetical protein